MTFEWWNFVRNASSQLIKAQRPTETERNNQKEMLQSYCIFHFVLNRQFRIAFHFLFALSFVVVFSAYFESSHSEVLSKQSRAHVAYITFSLLSNREDCN